MRTVEIRGAGGVADSSLDSTASPGVHAVAAPNCLIKDAGLKKVDTPGVAFFGLCWGRLLAVRL